MTVFIDRDLSNVKIYTISRFSWVSICVLSLKPLQAMPKSMRQTFYGTGLTELMRPVYQVFNSLFKPKTDIPICSFYLKMLNFLKMNCIEEKKTITIKKTQYCKLTGGSKDIFISECC